MPIYEFTCSTCHHEFEELIASMKSKASPACPNCQSKATKKKISVFSPQANPAGSTPQCGQAADGTCTQAGCPFAQ